MDFLKKANQILRDHDAQTFVPSFVVVGNQSSGKSTVLSQLIDFELPTGDTTVTKAVTQITTHFGGQCEVIVSWKNRSKTFAGDDQKKRASEYLAAVFKGMKEINYDDKVYLELFGTSADLVVTDLPGVRLDGNRTPQPLEKLIKKEISNATAIMHIHEAAADPDTIYSTSLITSEGRGRVLHVMTKSDKLEKYDQLKSNLQNYISKVDQDSNSQQKVEDVCFVSTRDSKFISKWVKQFEEENSGTEVEFGFVPFSRKVKEVYDVNVLEKIPTFRLRLEELLKNAQNRLDVIGRVKPSASSTILACTTTVRERLATNFENSYKARFQVKGEEFQKGVNDYLCTSVKSPNQMLTFPVLAMEMNNVCAQSNLPVDSETIGIERALYTWGKQFAHHYREECRKFVGELEGSVNEHVLGPCFELSFSFNADRTTLSRLRKEVETQKNAVFAEIRLFCEQIFKWNIGEDLVTIVPMPEQPFDEWLSEKQQPSNPKLQLFGLWTVAELNKKQNRNQKRGFQAMHYIERYISVQKTVVSQAIYRQSLVLLRDLFTGTGPRSITYLLRPGSPTVTTCEQAIEKDDRMREEREKCIAGEKAFSEVLNLAQGA